MQKKSFSWIKTFCSKFVHKPKSNMPNSTFILASLEPEDLPTIFIDAFGRAYSKQDLKTLDNVVPIDETNRQVYYQVVKSYNKNNHTLVVVLQASIVSLNYNLETVCALTCGDKFACNQLFTHFLFQTSLTFKMVPNVLKKTDQLQLKAHVHSSSGCVTLMFKVV